MTGETAIKILQKRFPSTSVVANINWHLNKETNEVKKEATIYYNFGPVSCSSQRGNSFEECFERLDEIETLVDAEINRIKLLFREFGSI